MRRTIEPTDHTYTVTLTFHSVKPYTIAELQNIVYWWAFIRNRQVTVTGVTVKATTKGGTQT